MAIVTGTNGNDILNGTGASLERIPNVPLTGSFPGSGSTLVFSSDASDLVSNDTNGQRDVFTKDLDTGVVTLVSTNSSGVQANALSDGPVFSPDGTKVAFISFADNLVPGDTNGKIDIFVKDLATGAVTRVSADSGGLQADGDSLAPSFSPDGAKIVFRSFADNLVAGDTNGSGDIFVKDLATGAVTLATANSAGTQADGISLNPVFTPDGSSVAFFSTATNLVTGDVNGQSDIFEKNLATGAVTLLSTNSSGGQGNDGSQRFSFSPDGTKLAFESFATNLAPNDAFPGSDVFLKDLTTGQVTLLSADAAGVQANSSSHNPIFSPDGTKVAFESFSTNLVPGDTNGQEDVFIKDLATGDVTEVPLNTLGIQGNAESRGAFFSPDGSKLLFFSPADNLVPGDTNGADDLFIASLTGNDDVVVGNPGNDTLHGGFGNDDLDGGHGNDVVFGDNGRDVVKGGPGDDTVYGGNGDDSIDGNSGNDKVFGDAGDDTMRGSEGRDTMDGGAGNDTVLGDSGSDIVHGGAGNDRVSGNGSNDTVYGDDGDDVVSGGDGSDVVSGGIGNDTLTGESARDTLDGGDGNDVLNGGSGTDTLAGGTGADTFVFDRGALSGVDKVTDFKVAEGDKIELHDVLTGFTPDHVSDFIRITESGGNSHLFIDKNGAAGGHHFVEIAQLNGVTGLADVAQLLANHVLVVT